MLYTDTFFLLLFVLVWGIAKALEFRPAWKEWFLIGFSLLLIATWGLYDLTLFVVVLTINFFGASRIERAAPARSRAWLAGLVSFDVGVLVLFKYANFLSDSAHGALGVTIPRFPLGIPLAISFYTFHLISYLVDIQAGRVKVAGFRSYLFYLSFFPHVIAGPIVRAWQLIPQIGHVRKVRTDFLVGIHCLVVGFFLKSLANNVAGQIDPYWDGSTPFSALDHWLVAFFYYCQIYGDFAGYTLMALGMARLLGYRLPPNFRGPLLAASLQDFWRRWHITLSRWLRDYLYIPLGGNRVPPLRAAFNVFATMLLGGLWHGAGWGFLIWGAMHGGGLVMQRLAGRPPSATPPFRAGTTAAAAWAAWWIATQLWVTLAWVFFRAPSLPAAGHFLAGMVPGGYHWHLVHRPVSAALLFAAPIILHQLMPLVLPRIPRARLGLVLGLATGMMAAASLVLYSPSKTFIYFRF